MTEREKFIAVLAGATALSAGGAAIGDWWVAFGVGLAVGILVHQARWALPAGAASGLLGWAIPLGWEQRIQDLGPTASTLAKILGVPGGGMVPVVLTCMIGMLLGLVGAWLAGAIMAFTPWRSQVHAGPDSR